MNKNNNVCLGRRGRPKKNQQKPSLTGCVEALSEISSFSFFPLSNRELKNDPNKANPTSKLTANFANWYAPDTTSLQPTQNTDENLEEGDDSIKVSLNDEPEEMALGANSGLKTKSNFLPFLIFTNGHVWKMAFSPPDHSSDSISLALGIHPHESPVSQINKRYNGRGSIQIWSVPLQTPTDQGEEHSPPPPKRVLEITHDGLFCRLLEWVPHSGCPDKKSAGLLLCVLGDGLAHLLSVPKPEGETLPRRVHVDDLTVWKYSSPHYTVCSASIRIPDSEATCLRVAGTTAEGVLLVWTFEKDALGPSEQVIPVSQNTPLLSASWCPVQSSSLIAVCDNNGKISIVDFRRSNSSNVIKEFELPNRPITCVVWSRLTNNIYLSHGIGAVVLSVESGDYTQFTIEAYNKKKKYSQYEEERISPVLGSRSWTCCSLLHNAIFGFNDGSTVIGPCFEFESKSFQETLLVKALVIDPTGAERDREAGDDGHPANLGNFTLSSIDDHDHLTSSSSHDKMSGGDNDSETNSNPRLFNCMVELITKSYAQRVHRMKTGAVKILWSHEATDLNAVDFLQVQCITSVDPIIYPQLISQSFVAIAYFGGLVAIHQFS